MNERQLLDRVLYCVKENVGNREVVMYGRHAPRQEAIEREGIKINKIFTGNLKLLGDRSFNYIRAEELNGKASEYFVIIPFFLDDNGVSQRATMKRFGFVEYQDYIFFPEDFMGEMNVERLKTEIFSLHSQLIQTHSQLQEIKDTMVLYDAQNKLMLWQAMADKNEVIQETKKRFFLSMPKATGTLRKMQLAGVILLTKFDQVCRENGLIYWLSFGTLLGAVRHKGFIPWDDDTDVCMMRGEAEKLTKIMENDEEFYVSHIFADFDDNLNHCIQFKYRLDRTPYCLDIFIYDYCSDISPQNVKRQINLNAELAMEAQPIRKSDLSDAQKKEQYAQLLAKYLERSREIVGTTDTPSEYIIWALDNLRCRAPHQSNCAINSILPLKPIEFEGKEFMAPCNAEEYMMKKYGDIYSLPGDMLSHMHFHLDNNLENILEEIVDRYSYMLE